MFTGDRSGDWLFRALHKSGFANQAESTGRRDGLKLNRCAITNVCRCAPPDNKPNTQEVSRCQPFLKRTIEICKPTVYLALGGLAWKAIVRYAECEGWTERPQPKFGHGAVVSLGPSQFMLGSYHPSQQNTFTGRLTEAMFDEVFSIANRLIDESQR
jgi:uracil-DNA glycosylase family 4